MATSAAQIAKTGKFGDLRRRLVFLLLALVVYRIGAHIPVPGIDPDQLQQLFKSQEGGILNLFNMFSGGALSRFTVFALGIMPYISASIIMQLLTYVVPTFEQLKKEGEAGRRKITQYTRYGTLGLAIFQSLGIAVALESSAGLVLNPGFGFRMTAVVSLTDAPEMVALRNEISDGLIRVDAVHQFPGLLDKAIQIAGYLVTIK
ncbi:MAG: preprotein translocase subunit SecY, partial [Burkholderiaceae bacterium]